MQAIFGTNLWHKTRPLLGMTYPYLCNFARDIGVMRGHEDYTRFIILGRSRTGSNFLHGLLNSHRQIYTFGELFAVDEEIGWGLPGYRQQPARVAQFKADPIGFLNTNIFRDAPAPIQAVGFKIFYYHAQNATRRVIWSYLFAHPEIKVIHIKRANLLKMQLSRKRAEVTSRWIDTSSGHTTRPPIELDYEECLAAFVQTRTWEREYAKFFANHAVLDLCYETLDQDTQAEMTKVQKFLGVEVRDLSPKTYRQSSGSLSASILNYQELKSRFKDTEWYSFFAD